VISDKPVFLDDKVYLYYCGHSEEWTSWPPGNVPAAAQSLKTGFSRLDRMGLATLRRDGFAYLQTTDSETPGSATTCPIDGSTGDLELTVNVDNAQQNRSWVEVEVLSGEDDTVLSGFGRQDCTDVCRDGIRVPVGWRNRRLSHTGDPPIRLRFWLYGAVRLYAFGFEQT
jgi:hypothetical protein